MSMLTYDPGNDDDIYKLCIKECGVITATEDQQIFSICCIFCSEKFLYFDAFVSHMQTMHVGFDEKGGCGNIFGAFGSDDSKEGGGGDDDGIIGGMCEENGNAGDEEDLTDTALLEPQVVMIKEEITDGDLPCDGLFPTIESVEENVDTNDFIYNIKQEKPDIHENIEMPEPNYMHESYNYDEYSCDGATNEQFVEEGPTNEMDDDANYDDLVEESRLGGAGLAMHIKDRRMIQFLIDAYRRNPFLWDHCHMQFRDRIKRQQFLDWIVMEFKRRFNVSLAKDAVTRKWDNLRTVYKRECNRMAQEKTNVSTLWYFQELGFLQRLYNGIQQMPETVIKEAVYRRRYSALWGDSSTSKLLQLVEFYPCFYDKYNSNYRSKEKRGEALQLMAAELQKVIDVTTIQISKRISQLRFDYSKQKQERLMCEQNNKMFVPTFTYYDQMLFMDADVAPFKCDFCPMILQSPRELDVHMLTHQSNNGLICGICHQSFHDIDELNRHKHFHTASEVAAAASVTNEKKYHCDLCTASFREKSNYDEHMRRHNDELFLPTLTTKTRNSTSNKTENKMFSCEFCGKCFGHQSNLSAHRAIHRGERHFKCEFLHCDRTFTARQSLNEHIKSHINNDDYKCDICGKVFRSSKNLQNHKQIHDAVKRYVCKICGSAFAQAAGLYLHKRRHNRQTENSRLKC